MLKNIEETTNKKEKEIARLQELKEKQEAKRLEVEQNMQAITEEETDLDAEIAKLQDDSADISMDIVMQDWTAHLDKYTKEKIDPIINELEKLKSSYLAKIDQLLKQMGEIESERVSIYKRLEKHGLEPHELSPLSVNRYRFPNDKINSIHITGKEEVIKDLDFKLHR